VTGLIYKILSVADWAAAQQAGRFEGSADDRRDGFIHFSDREQVVGTAAKYFAGQSRLVLLTVEPGRLADLRWEKSRGDALFPHLYGPLELDAVGRVDRLPDNRDAAETIAALLGVLRSRQSNHMPAARLAARQPRINLRGRNPTNPITNTPANCLSSFCHHCIDANRW
jgi:uncharacterized protein (DUF952 family)